MRQLVIKQNWKYSIGELIGLEMAKRPPMDVPALLAAISMASLLSFGIWRRDRFWLLCASRFVADKISDWHITELGDVVDWGKKRFKNDDKISFSLEIPKIYGENLLILSGVLQMLENPYFKTSELLERKPKFVLLDRLPLSKSGGFYVLKWPEELGGGSAAYQCLEAERENYYLVIDF